MRFRRVFLVIALTSTVFLAACASNKETEGARFEAGADVLEELQNPTTGASYSFDPLLPFDAIPPVYDPNFLPTDEIQYKDEELVIGVVLNGEAKAYSITVLRSREMVNDELAGIPILVTW
jgi:hypothetical protein